LSKQPYLPLYFGDFLAATQEWDGESASLYLTLLGHQWSAGSLPSEREKLARMVRWDQRRFNSCWKLVRSKFDERDGRLYNRRLEEHRVRAEEIASVRAAVGRKGGETTASRRQAIATPIATPIADILLHHPIQSNPEEELNPKNKRALRASAIDPEFGLTPERTEYAKQHLPNVDAPALMEAFRDHHVSRGTVLKDWDAGWRTWVRNALKFGYPMPRPEVKLVKTAPTAEQISQAHRDAADDNLRRLQALGLRP
jgi:uncharacterized protein YdaU (DUF1376 family)